MNELTRAAKFRAVAVAERNGRVADSMAVRLAIVNRMNAGEITLAEAQAELASIKSGAKAKGLRTREEVFDNVTVREIGQGEKTG